MLVEFGRVLVTLHRVDEAEALLREARASAVLRRDERSAFAALEGLAVARQRGASDPVRALALGREALGVARGLGDPDLMAPAHTLVGSPSGSLGLLDDEIAHCTQAVAVAEEAGRPPAAYPMGRVALGLHHQGQEADALAWADRAEAAAVDQHDEETLLLARWIRGLACAALGRAREAWAALDACAEVGRGEEVFWHARIPNTYGSILTDACQYRAALDRDLESLEVTAAASRGPGGLNPPTPPGRPGGLNPPTPPGRPGGLNPPTPPGAPVREAEFQTRLNLAVDHLGLGDLAAAADQLATVRAGADDVVYARFRWLARLHFLDAELASAGGRGEDALVAAYACLDLAARHGQPKYDVRGRLALARAQLASGEPDPARKAALAAARGAEQYGFRTLAWRSWWTADRAGAGPVAWRRAQAAVLRVAGGLDEPLRSRFLAAVPVRP